DITLLADVHDRTGFPLLDIPIEAAAGWAVHSGADALILTGRSYPESLQLLQKVRQSGVTKPLLMGGSATAEKVPEILQYADGIIVSNALKRQNLSPKDIVQWNVDLISRFMEAAATLSDARGNL